MNSNNQNQKKDEVGAIWIRTTKNGDKYCSITITIDGKRHDLVAFKNKFKDASSEADAKKPDYRVMVSQPRPEAPRARQQDNLEDVPF